jgi:hypothetical protein
MPKLIIEMLPRDSYGPLDACPFCASPGVSRPYLISIEEDWGDADPETFYVPVCDECRSQGSQCASGSWAVHDWNRVSSAVLGADKAQQTKETHDARGANGDKF